MQSNDQLLLQKIKESNYFAFEHLFKKYHQKLFTFTKRFIKDDHQAHEIVLDVFLRIWERREKISISKSLSSYLLISTKNHCLNFIRSRKSELSYYSPTDLQLLEIELLHYSDKLVLDDLMAKELLMEVDKAISNLPRQRQKIFRLSRFEGRTSKEIAETLKLSVRTVETHIHLSIKSLKDQLGGILY